MLPGWTNQIDESLKYFEKWVAPIQPPVFLHCLFIYAVSFHLVLSLTLFRRVKLVIVIHARPLWIVWLIFKFVCCSCASHATRDPTSLPSVEDGPLVGTGPEVAQGRRARLQVPSTGRLHEPVILRRSWNASGRRRSDSFRLDLHPNRPCLRLNAIVFFNSTSTGSNSNIFTSGASFKLNINIRSSEARHSPASGEDAERIARHRKDSVDESGSSGGSGEDEQRRKRK